MSGLTQHTIATIANGETESDSIRSGSYILLGIYVPAGFNGTAISFKASFDDETYQDIHDVSGLLALPVTADTYLSIDPQLLAGCRYLKIVSNAAESAERLVGVSRRSVE